MCPRCGNVQTQRTETVWQSQISRSHQRGGLVVGAAITGDGLIPGLGWRGGSDSVSMTDLGRILAPPTPPPQHRITHWFWALLASYLVGSTIGIMVIAVCIALLDPGLFNATSQSGPLILLGMAGGFIAALWYFRRPPTGWLARQQAYEEERRRWQEEWFCARCGNRWQLAASSSIVPRPELDGLP